LVCGCTLRRSSGVNGTTVMVWLSSEVSTADDDDDDVFSVVEDDDNVVLVTTTVVVVVVCCLWWWYVSHVMALHHPVGRSFLSVVCDVDEDNKHNGTC
jgi:hypothetical protein